MYTVDELVTGQELQVHVTRMILYADAVLNVVGELKEVVPRIQEELRLAGVSNIGHFDIQEELCLAGVSNIRHLDDESHCVG